MGKASASTGVRCHGQRHGGGVWLGREKKPHHSHSQRAPPVLFVGAVCRWCGSANCRIVEPARRGCAPVAPTFPTPHGPRPPRSASSASRFASPSRGRCLPDTVPAASSCKVAPAQLSAVAAVTVRQARDRLRRKRGRRFDEVQRRDVQLARSGCSRQHPPASPWLRRTSLLTSSSQVATWTLSTPAWARPTCACPAFLLGSTLLGRGGGTSTLALAHDFVDSPFSHALCALPPFASVSVPGQRAAT